VVSTSLEKNSMGPIGHFSVGLAAKPAAPRVPLGVLLLATWLLDILAISFGYAGFQGGQVGNPWSDGLLMSVVWSAAFGLLATRTYRNYRAGMVVGLLVFWSFGFQPLGARLHIASHPFLQLFLAFVAVELRTPDSARSPTFDR
jgi:hypothetical protein